MNLVLLDEYDLKVKCERTGRMKFWTMVAYKTEKLRADAGLFRNADEKRAYLELQELEAKALNYLLITIRPKEIEVADLLCLAETVCKKKWLKGCLWVLEQKGVKDVDVGLGSHIHILCRQTVASGRNKTVGSMIKEIMGTCTSLKVEIMENCIDIKIIPKKDLGQAKNYLLGQKKDLKKREAQRVDKVWRVKNDLKDSYGELA